MHSYLYIYIPTFLSLGSDLRGDTTREVWVAAKHRQLEDRIQNLELAQQLSGTGEELAKFLRRTADGFRNRQRLDSTTTPR